jgi:erythromycin esterase-like protein
MAALRRDRLAAIVRGAAHPLRGRLSDYDGLLAAIGDAQVVLIGEASHGTHEFYVERARITRQLIEKGGFAAVCVEGDWPAAYRVNRFVRGTGDDTAAGALDDFRRFPAWLWRNRVVVGFTRWLRRHNNKLRHGSARAVGFYGIDLYSLYASMRAVIAYLETVDKQAARRARAHYGCFDHFREDPRAYGFVASIRANRSCEEGVIRQLHDLRSRSAGYLKNGGPSGQAEYFFAEQNAHLAVSAERYYRATFEDRVSSWNVRDTHMADVLEALIAYLGHRLNRPKIVVWAHNTHLGDARATEASAWGQHSLGELLRLRYGSACFNIGFTTYAGTVTASEEWDRPPTCMIMRPALPASYEGLFHHVGLGRFWLDFRGGGPLADALRDPRLERSVGAIYRHRTERTSHYFRCRLSAQFDAVIHVDLTSAVVPLDQREGWQPQRAAAETDPSGI